jgi:hypothetical protein
VTGVSDAAISIVIVSHNKPTLLPEAVQSVLQQSFADWQGILIDSGLLHDRGFFNRSPWGADPRLRIVRSAETPALRRRKAMAPWCFNECFRHGWVRGELVMYLCDDDILYPHAFRTFVDAFRQNPGAMAMYASQDLGWVGPDGRSVIVGERRAIAPGGKCCNGRLMDCQVDYLQLCHRRAVLRAFRDEEYWPEDKASEDHADGLFMEKLGRRYPILPIDLKVGQNRRTPWSINVPATSTGWPGLRHPEPPASGTSEYLSPGHTSAQAVHETIMDAWTRAKCLIDLYHPDEACRKVMADFQDQLRRLCEQDHAQRRRLVSRRYRLVDRLHALLSWNPGFSRSAPAQAE